MTDRTTYGDGRSPQCHQNPAHSPSWQTWLRMATAEAPSVTRIPPIWRQCNINANSMQIQYKFQCKFNDKSMKSQCKFNANPMQIQCNFNANSMKTQCKLNVNYMQIQCPFKAYSMQIQCRFNAHSIHIQCRWNAISMQIQCTINAILMRSEIIQFNFNKPWHVLSWWGLFEAK